MQAVLTLTESMLVLHWVKASLQSFFAKACKISTGISRNLSSNTFSTNHFSEHLHFPILYVHTSLNHIVNLLARGTVEL